MVIIVLAMTGGYVLNDVSLVVLHEIGALSSRCIYEIPQPYCQLYCVMVIIVLAMTGGYVLNDVSLVVLHEIGALSARCIYELPQPYCQLYCVMVMLAMTGGCFLNDVGWTGKDGSRPPPWVPLLKSYGSSILSTSLGSKTLNNTSSLGLGGTKI